MGIDFTPDPALYPFQPHWFESSQGRIHYIDEGPLDGKGPALLLCHGNPTWSFLYRNIVIALRDRFRCIAPDYLGFGLSDRPVGSATRPTSMPGWWASSSITSAWTAT